MYYVWFTILVVLSGVCLFGTLLALPGNWAMVIVGALFAWLVPNSGLSWTAVGIAGGLAVVGEILEFAAGAAGAAKLGARKRSLALSMVATVVGSLAGSVAVPIPIVGTVIGALAGGALGAYAGAYAGERSAGTDARSGHRIGSAAMKGRLLGTFGKLVLGAAIFAVIVTDAWQ